MTPAIKLAKKHGIKYDVHQYEHDPSNTNFGHEAAEVLGIDPDRVFKTLLFSLNGDAKNLAVAVVPVSGMLDLRRLQKLLVVKKLKWPILNWQKK